LENEYAIFYPNWATKKGIYLKYPSIGIILVQALKMGHFGYREVNWSLPRERIGTLGDKK